jgi:hypothetical protein
MRYEKRATTSELLFFGCIFFFLYHFRRGPPLFRVDTGNALSSSSSGPVLEIMREKCQPKHHLFYRFTACSSGFCFLSYGWEMLEEHHASAAALPNASVPTTLARA